MPQPKGKTGNPNGRPKGSLNKRTKETRQWIDGLINGNRKQLEADLRLLKPNERWSIVEKLLQFVVPKMQSIDANIDLHTLTDEQLATVITEVIERVQNED
jgi:hypothetical protein